MSNHRRHQPDPARSSDPAIVGLCRAMLGLSLVLIVGLMALFWSTVGSGVDWDASVVQGTHDNGQGRGPAESDPGMDSSPSMSNAIGFDLDQLDSEGLFGPEDGLRALSYEFCIPAAEEHVTEVEAIDSTIVIQRRSTGRIGCVEGEYLASGHTHQPDFREVLIRLSHLPYVDRIEQAHFE